VDAQQHGAAFIHLVMEGCTDLESHAGKMTG